MSIVRALFGWLIALTACAFVTVAFLLAWPLYWLGTGRNLFRDVQPPI